MTSRIQVAAVLAQALHHHSVSLWLLLEVDHATVSSNLSVLMHCAGETCGSILSPSAEASIVGIKPTPGLVSRTGCIPISVTSDTVGPMAQDVKTCAAVLQAIAGKDPQDSLTDCIPFDKIPDYMGACQTGSLKGVRLGASMSCP